MSYSFTQRKPCPGCNGYAGAFKKSKRCRGFRHRDGEGIFCEVPNTPVGSESPSTPFNFSGYDLYYYKHDLLD